MSVLAASLCDMKCCNAQHCMARYVCNFAALWVYVHIPMHSALDASQLSFHWNLLCSARFLAMADATLLHIVQCAAARLPCFCI